MNFIIDYLTSWFSIITSGCAATLFFLYFIYVKFRPPVMVKCVHSVLRFIRNTLKNNRAFMRWLYGSSISEQIEADYAGGKVVISSHWRSKR